MHTLRVLGNVVLEGPAGPLSGSVTQPRQLAVLAMLATAGSAGLSRDKLVACLFPEADDTSARHSLADAVYRLRKELGRDAIEGRTTKLRLNPAVVHTDIVEFEQALESGDLTAAADAYRGSFLDGFHLSDSSEFEDWRGAEARCLEQKVEGVLETLADRAAAKGEHACAVELLRRLLALDPYNSHTVMRLMEALAARSDVGNALKLAEEHGRFLSAELGLEPPQDLLELARRLRAAGESARAAPGAAPAFPFEERRAPVAVAGRTAFAGREAELARLHVFLDEAVGGGGRVVFLSGEAGTGKTMLAGEFCRQAAERVPDLVIAGGYGNAHTGPGDPYLPFREVLDLLCGGVEARYEAGSLSRDQAVRLWNFGPLTTRALVEKAPDLLDTFVSRSELCARLNRHGANDPDWLASLGALRDAPTARGPAPRQAALFDQYVRLLKELSRAKPLLLVLDDLQWADTGSIGLLFHLGRELSGHRILVLGLFRPTDVAIGRDGGRHPLEPVVNELKQAFGDTEVALREGGDRAFVDALVDSEPNALDAEFRAALFRQAGGHALFTVEMLRALHDAGVLRREKGRWLAGQPLDWSLMPARIQAMLGERIGRLPSALRRILEVASVEGETFTLEATAAVLGKSVGELLPLVGGDLERTFRLVRPVGLHHVDGQRVSEFRFRHILFQRYLYDRLDPIERAYLHEGVAEALEALLGESADAIALGRHFREAGNADKASRYLLVAGVRAFRAGAIGDALEHLESALELVLRLPPGEARDRRELDIQAELGTARVQGAVPDHGAAYARARDLAERLGDDRALFRALFGLFYARGHYRGDNRRGFAIADECLSLARKIGDDSHLAVAYDNVGRNAYMRGDFVSALASYQEALRLSDRESRLRWCDATFDLDTLAEGMVGLVLCKLGYEDQCRNRCANAVAVAREFGNPITTITVLWYEVLMLLVQREVDASYERSVAMAAMADESGLSQGWGTMAAFPLGWSQAFHGEVDLGLATLGKALADWASFGWEAGTRYFTALYAELLGLCGRADEGLREIDATDAAVTERLELFAEAEVLRVRGDLLLALAQPEPEAAEATYRSAIDLARTQQARLFELRAATSLARLLRKQDREAEARPMLAEIYDWFAEGFDAPDLVDARAFLDELG